VSAAMHHVASAALPVALGLLVCAAGARAALRWDFGDEPLQRSVREHLEPLCVWCLGALVIYVFARSASGGSLLTSLFLGATVAAAVLALWQADEEPASEERDVTEPAAAIPSEPLPPDDPPRQGLWSRGLPG
jgi:H+/Cl- antiporter ClcA